MPIKVERAHFDPELIIFHDVITDNEISKLKELARPSVSILILAYEMN